MRKIIILSVLTSLFAGELEVEGNLTVTEGVNASSFVGDGSGLTNISSLGGMTPERIYSFRRIEDGTFNLTVPQNKMWIIDGVSDSNTLSLHINGYLTSLNGYKQGQITLLPGTIISESIHFDNTFMLSIYEYSVSNSGNDQGMDYVEP